MARISIRKDTQLVKVLLGEVKSTSIADQQAGKEDNKHAGKIAVSDVFIEAFREYRDYSTHVKVSLTIGSLYFAKVFVFTDSLRERVAVFCYDSAADTILPWLEEVVKGNNGYLQPTAVSSMLRDLYNLTRLNNAR